MPHTVRGFIHIFLPPLSKRIQVQVPSAHLSSQHSFLISVIGLSIILFLLELLFRIWPSWLLCLDSEHKMVSNSESGPGLRLTVRIECLAEIGQASTAKSATGDSTFSQIVRSKAVHYLAFFLLVYVGVEVTIGGQITFLLDHANVDFLL